MEVRPQCVLLDYSSDPEGCNRIVDELKINPLTASTSIVLLIDTESINDLSLNESMFVADEILFSPFNVSEITKTICELIYPNSLINYLVDRDMEVFNLVAKVINNLGFDISLKGTENLRDCVYLYLKHRLLNADHVSELSITKHIYPIVAELNKTNSCCVERNIRNCVRILFTKSNNYIYEDFKNIDKIPSNKKIIFKIVDKIFDILNNN